MKAKGRLNLSLVIVLLVVFSNGCDAWVNLSGQVFDGRGEPLRDAVINLYQGSSKIVQVTSDSQGKYKARGSIAPVGSNLFHLIVTKEGFKTFEKELSENELRSNRKDVILERE